MAGMKRLCIPLLILLPFAPQAGAAAPSCAQMSAAAGEHFGVPQGLMPAISLVETGTKGGAWPWTLNEGGKGMHFDTRQEALAYLTEAVARGVTNIDVGCMQLNYRWHAKGFPSLEAMLDPERNTTYAALFLVELRKRLGSWEAATAHYHSADAERGKAYVAKVVAAAGQGPAEAGPADQLADQAVSGQDAPQENLRGILLASAGSLVTVPSAEQDYYERAIEGAANGLANTAPDAAPPVTLRAREELPPRLSNRWAAILAARETLAQMP